MSRRRVSEQADSARRHFEETEGRALDNTILEEFVNTVLNYWWFETSSPPSKQATAAAAIFILELGQRATDGDDLNKFVRDRLCIKSRRANGFYPDDIRISDPEFAIVSEYKRGRLTHEMAVSELARLGVSDRNARKILTEEEGADLRRRVANVLGIKSSDTP